MDWNTTKCVIVIDDTLPAGVIANTATILGITLGRTYPGLVGPDTVDSSGYTHPGIVAVPIPVLAGTPAQIRALHDRLQRNEFADVYTAGFTDLARQCRTYEEYQARMRTASPTALRYLGLVLYGQTKTVRRLTGSLPLLKHLHFIEQPQDCST